MDIREGSDVYQVALEVRGWLSDYAKQDCVLLASGGSSAHILARAWEQLTPEERSHIIISLADERFGAPGHADSNWKLLQDLGINLDDSRHIPVLTCGATMMEDATTWSNRLQPIFASDMPIIAMLGMGDDSHIAGIKPGSPAASEDTKIVVAFEWEDYKRITISPIALKRLDSATLYISGEAKRRAVEALKRDYDPVNYPSQFMKTIKDYRIYYQP